MEIFILLLLILASMIAIHRIAVVETTAKSNQQWRDWNGSLRYGPGPDGRDRDGNLYEDSSHAKP